MRIDLRFHQRLRGTSTGYEPGNDPTMAESQRDLTVGYAATHLRGVSATHFAPDPAVA
jgi:hypothetical protein